VKPRAQAHKNPPLLVLVPLFQSFGLGFNSG